jgi:acetylornithine deacetylase/succinyl-diaminopimelate desuccinylase-like protein
MIRFLVAFAALVASIGAGRIDATDAAVQAARAWRVAHERGIIDEFIALLSLPNDAHRLADIRKNSDLLRRMLEARGLTTRLLEAGPDVAPAVFGELRTPGATRTIVFYAHYDGQPTEPERWFNKAPFTPTLLTAALDAGGQPQPLPAPDEPFDPAWRLYARSAGDDKAPIIALVTALDGLKAAGLRPRVNVKVFLEGEEERGSPNLETILRAHRALLDADLWLFCDGPVHQSGRPQVVFGVRGSAGLTLTVYGPRRELHSGHYGNWAPNPAMMLAQLLASMEDAEGRVLVKGFYDGVVPLGENERRAIQALPAQDAELMRELWLGRTEGNGRRLEELIAEPSLNVRGLASAAVGTGARNVVPAEATASIDLRLVKGTEHRAMIEKVVAHVREQGYFVTEDEPGADVRRSHPRVARVTVSNGGYDALRTPMDLNASKDVVRAVERARGPVLLLPTAGGSLPLSIFDEVFKVPVVMVPIANHDNNQHAHNENLRLQNLWDGIEVMAALLTLE